MKFHKDGSLPQGDEIWVFGSNLAGAHGAGAARVAREVFGAQFGIGVGMTGWSYAIPTKDREIETLPLDTIQRYVDKFIRHARRIPRHQFFVTAIGCGLAGYKHEQIAPMFADAPENCSFPDAWRPFLDKPEPELLVLSTDDLEAL